MKNEAKINFQDIFLCFAIIVVLICSYYTNEDILSMFVGLFGIIYTVLIGRGVFIAYLFGIIGTLCGILLSFKLNLWGNLFLHLLYYLPMMIAGFFSWKANVDKEKNEVIKKRLKGRDFTLFSIFCAIISAAFCLIFIHTNNPSPFLDAIITVFSVFAMFLTVGRYVEQWIVWIFIDFLLVVMWFLLFQGGSHTLAILISRVVYLVLGIYFFKKWRESAQ